MAYPPTVSIRKALRRHGPLLEHERITVERVLAGLTAIHCARAMGWNHTKWQRVELGERPLTEEERPRVAQILGITLDRLLGQQVSTVPGYMKRGRPRREQAAA